MSKYGAKKIIYNGITFDSKKEYGRYLKLNAMQQRGEISNLQTQVKFLLIPSQREPDIIGVRGGTKKGKTIEKEVAYIADFVYCNAQGQTIVEDVKGYRGGGAYTTFVIKRKLMLYVHKLRVIEV